MWRNLTRAYSCPIGLGVPHLKQIGRLTKFLSLPQPHISIISERGMPSKRYARSFSIPAASSPEEPCSCYWGIASPGFGPATLKPLGIVMHWWLWWTELIGKGSLPDTSGASLFTVAAGSGSAFAAKACTGREWHASECKSIGAKPGV